MLLAEVVETSAAVASTSARSAKISRLAGCLVRLGPGEVAVGVAFLSGELRQRQIGVGYASMRDLPAPVVVAPVLELSHVDAVFAAVGEVAGPGSQARRRELLAGLFAQATDAEHRFLGRLLTGELRQGAAHGVMAAGIARAANVPLAAVRRALMLSGSPGEVAEAALVRGVAGLRAFRLQVGRPLQPMLASTASSVADALERISPAAVEWKLDGARVQVHRQGRDVAVFTRTLDDITARVPEVVELALAVPVQAVVLDGEAIALRDDGRPHPFQETGRRLGSQRDVAALREALPLRFFGFDVLHLDGEDLVDRTGAERHRALAGVLPALARIPRVVTEDVAEAGAFLQDALGRGHEGVVVKALDTPYEAGRRGAGWIKVKPVHSLDLVVLAAEWGHGRRRSWLSNLHLGARDGDGFVMLGKTFKGLTDELLTWQTGRLLELETHRDGWTVYVRPELVVEIAFDGIQTSSRYPGGLTLRFARVLRYREDKRASDADTLTTLRTFRG